jgi:hypothetical protein
LQLLCDDKIKAMIKSIQYVCVGLLITIFMEGMFTLGNAFYFETYNAFGWITQGVIIIGVVTTAIRIANEEGK